MDSGYLPVTKTANNKDAIAGSGAEVKDSMLKTLNVGVDIVNSNEMYTTKAFEGGTQARNILEYSLSDKAAADREAVVAKMQQGLGMEESVAEYLLDDNFDAWYEETLQKLQAFVQ